MNGGAVISMVLCAAILTARYLLPSGGRQRRTGRHWLTTARLLLAAALALAAVSYRLQRQVRGLEGRQDHNPSVIERIVLALSR